MDHLMLDALLTESSHAEGPDAPRSRPLEPERAPRLHVKIGCRPYRKVYSCSDGGDAQPSSGQIIKRP